MFIAVNGLEFVLRNAEKIEWLNIDILFASVSQNVCFQMFSIMNDCCHANV